MRPFRALGFALVFSLTLAAAPSITGVYNAASWVPPSLPNSGVAQGAIFTVTGTGLGPSTLQQVTAYPLPTTQGLAGTTITVTVGSVTETCIMVYTYATQVAAILPSATPTGTGTLRLTYQGATASFTFPVIAKNFGTFTLNEGGTGPGVFTDASYNPITMLNAAHPGETLILWGSGLGAVSGSETAGPPVQVDLGTGVQVFVAGQPATVLYGGRGSSPGLDQINFVVPAGISGCRESVYVSVNGVVGNVTMIAVSPAGQTTCGDTYGPLTTANMQKALNTGTLNIAGVQLSSIAGDSALTAYFGSYNANSLVRSYGGTPGPDIGSCAVYETYGSTLSIADPVQPSYLDAGSQLQVTGPNGTKTFPQTSTGNYSATLASSTPAFLAPGNFTVSNGAGGAGVGAFSWSLAQPSNIVPTNLPTRVTRSQPLTLTWSGGAGFNVATIFGITGLAVTSTQDSFVEFICNADASAGQFTVPSAVLSLLPANGFGSPGVPGVNIQLGGGSPTRFTATGLDAGSLEILFTTGAIATIQ